MKRTELKRHKPLVARSGLQPGQTQLRRSEMKRGKPLAPVSARRRRDNAHRAVVVSAMRLACAGQCAHCGRRDMPVRGHERLARAHGGDILRPDALVCDPCNGSFEDNPRLAAWRGWKISSKWPHDHTLTADQAWDLAGNIVEFTVAADEVA